jgi:hypothetical protein
VPPRNQWFTGREDLLDRLRAGLGGGGTTALAQAVAGPGGVGKTELTVEHCYRSLGAVEVVWWLRAEDPAVALSDLAALAPELGAPEAGLTLAEQAAVVRRRLEDSERPWLLVFDNVEDLGAMEPLGPDHPDTLRTRVNLARRYAEAGKPGDACAVAEEVLADYEHLRGPDHRDTARARQLLESVRSRGTPPS